MSTFRCLGGPMHGQYIDLPNTYAKYDTMDGFPVYEADVPHALHTMDPDTTVPYHTSFYRVETFAYRSANIAYRERCMVHDSVNTKEAEQLLNDLGPASWNTKGGD